MAAICSYDHCSTPVHELDPHGTCVDHSPCWDGVVFHPENCEYCKRQFANEDPSWSRRVALMRVSAHVRGNKMSWASEDIGRLFAIQNEQSRLQVAAAPL